MKQKNSNQRLSIIVAMFLGITAVLTLLFFMMGWGGQTAAVSAAPTSPTAPVIYVDIDATGANDGTSWSNAYPNLQDALNAATTNSEFWVAEGVYYPDVGGGQSNDDRSATFNVKNGLALYGGFAATETVRTERNWMANITVLSGDIDHETNPDTTDSHGVITGTVLITLTDSIKGDNAFHVVHTLPAVSALLDGFTITAGLANGGTPLEQWGGGIFLQVSEMITLTNLALTGNRALEGGGISSRNTSSSTLTDVSFTGNRAINGGGMYDAANETWLKNVLFKGNWAQGEGQKGNGGGMHINTPLGSLDNLTFSGNKAGLYGGGLSTESLFPPISNITFFQNQAKIGGGMANDGGRSTLTDSKFIENEASQGGGMANLYGGSPTITNVSFSANKSDLGGGMYNVDEASPTLTNISFDANLGSAGGGMHNVRRSNPNLTNATFKNNIASGGGGGMYNNESSPTLTNITFLTNTSILQGGAMTNRSSSPILTHVLFSGNQTGNTGGGMFNEVDSSPILTDVTFLANETTKPTFAATGGGGMGNLGGSPMLTNVTFQDNSSLGFGGGMDNRKGSNPIMSQVIFSGNLAHRDGGGMNNNSSNPKLSNVLFSGNFGDNGGGLANTVSSPSLTNVTFSGNIADKTGGGMTNHNSSPVIHNTIFWNNVQGNPLFEPYLVSIQNDNSTPIIQNSLVEGSGGSSSWAAGVGTNGGSNIDTDPLFVMLLDSTNITTTRANPGDLRLRPGSPAADVGDNSLLPAGLTIDMNGSPRIINGIVDMGVYETVVACPPQGTTTLHVQQGETGLSGATWADALGSLQDALSLAEGCGGIHDIWVASGVYYPDIGAAQSDNDRTQSFQLLNGVGVYGGFSGHETIRTQRSWRSNLTVLSGDIDGNDGVDANGIITDTANINGANSYHVVSGSGTDSSAALDGFTITAGQAASPAASSQHAGGGLLNAGGSPTLAHLAFTGNVAQDGGGMANLDSSHPTLTNIAFSANMATLFGGGLYNNDSHPTLTNVAVSGNAAFSGGGIFNQHSDPDLINLTVTGNQAVSGLTVDGLNLPSAIATVPTGGGMFNNDSSPLMRNSIFWNNKDSSGTGSVSATIHNADFGSLPSYAYSLIQSSGGSGAWISDFGFDNGHNIDADPLFRTAVDPAVAPSGGGDLELTHNSPAIDTAFNSYNSSDTDLAGDPRIADGDENGTSLIDMGAYEFWHLEVVKTASKASAQVGETITYTYVISNNSTVTIDNLTAMDDKLGEVTLGTTTLAAGAGTSGLLTYTIKDTDPSPLINIVAVTGETPTAVVVGGSASASVALIEHAGNPAISAKVTADKTSAEVGETITYTYLVTNTGDEPLDNILANDSFGWINLDKSTLAPAESTSVEVKHTVTADDLPSPLINTLTVKDSPPVGDDVTAQDQVPVVISVRKFIYLPVILKQDGP